MTRAATAMGIPVGQLPPQPLRALLLPWPPSLNHYWRHVGGRVLISADGRLYRRRVSRCVLAHVAGRPPLWMGRLAVHIAAFPPDRRARDVDNLAKSVLDALTHAGLWQDDSQIDRLTIERLPPVAGGALHISVATMAPRVGGEKSTPLGFQLRHR